MMVQHIIYGWRNDQDHKPRDQAIVRLRAGTRHKTRMRWYAPSRGEYEAYLGRTTKMPDPWGRQHAVLEILPETEPVWRGVRGFVIMANDGNQVRVGHARTGLAFWVHRSRVFTPGRYAIHDIGEYGTWSRVDLSKPAVGGDPHLHVEVTEEGEGR